MLLVFPSLSFSILRGVLYINSVSRSVSILSRGGDSNSSLNWQQQHFFKPIDPNDEEEDEDDYSGDDDELFVKIGGYESGDTTSVSSRRSTPLDSDIWLLPTAAKNKRSSNSSYRPYNDPDGILYSLPGLLLTFLHALFCFFSSIYSFT